MQNKLITKKLDNGLTIFMYPDKNKHTTLFSLITKFGGVNGDFELNGQKYHIENGMAHLLEHLLLEHSRYGNLMNVLRKMHMDCNGITNILKTEYYFSCADKLEEGIEVLINGINNPVFTSKDLEETKPAIYEEIRMNSDSKFRNLFEVRNKQLFKEIPYLKTAGTINNVASFDYELVLNTYNAFYRPSNQIIVVAGNFDVDKVLNQVKDLYDKLPLKNDKVLIKKYEEPKEVNNKYLVQKENTAEDIVSITYKIDVKDLTSEQLLSLDFYLSYFGQMNFGVNSNLYQKLINDKTVIDFWGEHLFVNNVVVFTISGYVKDEVVFTKEVINQIKNPCFDEELFKLYQKDSKMQIAVRNETIGKMVEPLVDNIISFDYPYFDSIEQIDNYSFEQFKEIISSLDFSNYVITKLEKNE